MKNKKGALELSVTAIVVLILAIVMLGLGLGFVRGMFGKVSTTLEEQISAEPEPAKASASDPITLSRENVLARPGQPIAIKASIFNPTNAQWSLVYLDMQCKNTAGTDVTATIFGSPTNTYQFKKANILNSMSSFTTLISFVVNSGQTPGSYLCQLTVAKGNPAVQDQNYRKEIVLTIKS